jgi:hypothetical protein
MFLSCWFTRPRVWRSSQLIVWQAVDEIGENYFTCLLDLLCDIQEGSLIMICKTPTPTKLGSSLERGTQSTIMGMAVPIWNILFAVVKVSQKISHQRIPQGRVAIQYEWFNAFNMAIIHIVFQCFMILFDNWWWPNIISSIVLESGW